MKEILVKEMGTIHVTGTHTKGTSKPVICVTTGKAYASCLDAAEDAGVHISTISCCCRGKQKIVNVNGEKRVYKFIKEEPENCVDALATTLQGKLELLDKYGAIIAELEAEERQAIARERERLEEEERLKREAEKRAKLEEQRARRINILQKRCDCAKEKFDKLDAKRFSAYISYEEAKLELKQFVESTM
jgi:N12 class adenine-specific DNA methylase